MLRTARLDDTTESPACDARARRIQDVLRGRRASVFDGPSLADGVRRGGSTRTVVVDPPTVRAARHVVDTTDRRRPTRAPCGRRARRRVSSRRRSSTEASFGKMTDWIVALFFLYRSPPSPPRHSAAYNISPFARISAKRACADKSRFIYTRIDARATHDGAPRRRGTSTTTERRPSTVRAARHVVDTTDGRRATRAHGEFKMSCFGDARRRSSTEAPFANPNGKVVALGLPHRSPPSPAWHSAAY